MRILQSKPRNIEVAGFPSFKQVTQRLKKSFSGDVHLPYGEFDEMFPKAKAKSDEGMYQFLLKHFKQSGPTYRLYRMLHGMKGTRALQNPNNKLGTHWSDVRINTSGGRVRDGKSFYLCAEVPASSIDWIDTFEAHLVLPYEREFYVKGPVHLVGILDPQGNVVWENPNKHNKWKTA